MLRALAEGMEDDPAVLAEFAKGKLRKKLALLRQTLEGRVAPHHRLLIGRKRQVSVCGERRVCLLGYPDPIG